MCELENKIAAYHDDELDRAERAEVENHLAACAQCQRSLEQLRAISGLFAGMSQPRLSQISRYRLHHKVADAIDSGLLRLAWTMSGIAASVVLLGSAWLIRAKEVPAAPAEAPPWVAVSMATSRDPVVRDSVSPAAEWYLADASSNETTENR